MLLLYNSICTVVSQSHLEVHTHTGNHGFDVRRNWRLFQSGAVNFAAQLSASTSNTKPRAAAVIPSMLRERGGGSPLVCVHSLTKPGQCSCFFNTEQPNSSLTVVITE